MLQKEYLEFIKVPHSPQERVWALLYGKDKPFIPLRLDWVHKVIFHDSENVEYAAHFWKTFSRPAHNEKRSFTYLMKSITKAISKRFQVDSLVHMSAINHKKNRDDHNATEVDAKWKDKNTEEILVLEVQCQNQSYVIPRTNFYAFKCYLGTTGTVNADYMKLRDIYYVMITVDFCLTKKRKFVVYHEIVDVDGGDENVFRGIFYILIQLVYLGKEIGDKLENDQEKWGFAYKFSDVLSKSQVDEHYGDDPIFQGLFKLLALINLSNEEIDEYNKLMKELNQTGFHMPAERLYRNENYGGESSQNENNENTENSLNSSLDSNLESGQQAIRWDKTEKENALPKSSGLYEKIVNESLKNVDQVPTEMVKHGYNIQDIALLTELPNESIERSMEGNDGEEVNNRMSTSPRPGSSEKLEKMQEEISRIGEKLEKMQEEISRIREMVEQLLLQNATPFTSSS
jgi:hypothetical protein